MTVLTAVLSGRTPSELAWMDDSVCRQPGQNPDLWYPQTATGANEAKQICAVCPVWSECREYGLREPAGIFGGLNERERRNLIRRRRERPNRPAW